MLRPLLALLLSCTFGFTQEVPTHRLRLLALGDPPPFRQEVRDGARYEIPAADGTVPPRKVTIPLPPSKPDDNPPAPIPLQLRLGLPTPPISFPSPAQPSLPLLDGSSQPWLKIALRPCGSSFALIWKTGTKWNQTRTLVLDDDATTRQPGNVIVTNLTAKPMAVQIGTRKLRIDPARTHLLTGNPTTSFPAVIQYPDDQGKLRIAHSGTIDPRPGFHHRIIIHPADAEGARSPVKATIVELE